MKDAGPAAALHGVLPVDKDAGRTSAAVVDTVKRVTGERSAGHAGTLDPPATGLLLICLGRATRIVPYLQALAKRYRVTIRFGVRTTTDDAEGDVLDERGAGDLDEGRVRETLARFVGEIDQRPPRVSAVKVGGERAYAKARRGEEFDLAPRRVRIDRIDLIDWQPPCAVVDVTCGSGTYMRSLARDAGDALGVGGIVQALRRTGTGPFEVDLALPEREITREAVAARLLGIDAALSFLPLADVDAEGARRLLQGIEIESPGDDGLVRVRGPAGFVGVGRRAAGRLRPERNLT